MIDSSLNENIYTETPSETLEDVCVSIVVPMYLCEAFVEGFLDNICGQDYRNIEVICVIDGSPDQTQAKAEQYAKKDSRVHVVSQPHRCAGVARNLGLSLAKGKYILFLDADDIYSYSFVSRMVQSIEENDADIAVCRFRKENYLINSVKPSEGFLRRYLPRGNIIDPSQIRYMFCLFNAMAHNKLYRRDFILSHNLQFSSTNSSNDRFFVFISLICAQRIALIDDVLYTYRVNTNPNSITSNKSRSKNDGFYVYNEIYNWLKENNVAEYYLDAFCNSFRSVFRNYARYGVTQEFQDAAVNYFTTQEPWCSMSGKKLYRMASLDTNIATLIKWIKTRRLNKGNTDASSKAILTRIIKQRESEIANIDGILNKLKDKNIIRKSLRISLIHSLLWRAEEELRMKLDAILLSAKNKQKNNPREDTIK